MEKKKDDKKSLNSPETVEERKKALEAVFGVIEKQYGKGSIMKLGSVSSVDIDAIPTGSMTLDLALGIGGVP